MQYKINVKKILSVQKKVVSLHRSFKGKKNPTTMTKQVYKANEQCSRLDRFGAAVVGASTSGIALFVSLFKSNHNEKKCFSLQSKEQ